MKLSKVKLNHVQIKKQVMQNVKTNLYVQSFNGGILTDFLLNNSYKMTAAYFT